MPKCNVVREWSNSKWLVIESWQARRNEQMLIQKKQKGQGVVEYAGALVIAALIVTAVIAAGPDNLATMFNAVVTDVEGSFTAQL